MRRAFVTILAVLTTVRTAIPETHVRDQRVSIDITDDKGVGVGQLVVEIGEHAVKKTKAFISERGLNFDYSVNLLNALCQRDDFPCKEVVNLPIIMFLLQLLLITLMRRIDVSWDHEY